MNSFSSYHSSPSDKLLKRFRLWKRQYLHVVIYTSLFWIFIDVFFIMLFSDCTKQIIVPCSSSIEKENNAHNNIKSIDDDLIHNPKFNLHKFNENNQTKINKNSLLYKKKISESKKKEGGFIAKWFGSDGGLILKLNIKERTKNYY